VYRRGARISQRQQVIPMAGKLFEPYAYVPLISSSYIHTHEDRDRNPEYAQ